MPTPPPHRDTPTPSPTPSKPNTQTHSGTIFPTSTPTSIPPSNPPPLTEMPTSHSPPSSPPTTTAPTRLPLLLPLRGTVISKDATGSCVGQPLDSHSPVVYDSLPGDKVIEYHNLLWERGYTLTYLTSFQIELYAESRYITIFAKKNSPNTVPRFRMNLRDMFLTAVGLRARNRYYFKDFVPAMKVDANGAKSIVYSGIFFSDPNIVLQQMNPVAPSHIVSYLQLRNGSEGVRTRREIQQVSSHRQTNGRMTHYVVAQSVKRPHKKYTLFSVSLAEAKHAINEFLKQGQYLESFHSYWHSPNVMRYNLIFTDKSMGNCNYKVTMDTDRDSWMENERLLIDDGWVPTMISTHRSESSVSINYITVWWK